MREFSELETVKFQEKMKPHALKIYQTLFPGCSLQDLREEGVKVHVLDKEFGIDCLLTFGSGQWISIQEKYRNNKPLTCKALQTIPPSPDFTQEYKNDHGGKSERPGEWFKLGAQLYFYGWANANQTGFEKWFLMDVAKYKMLVEQLGGIDRAGKLYSNKKHGKASFYAITVKKLMTSWIATHASGGLLKTQMVQESPT